MTRWSPRLFTGTRRWTGLALLGAALLVAAAPAPAVAQALKLAALHIPSTVQVGPWVSYRVRSQTRSLPVREYTQRVAIVARESNGFWVELKTEGLPSGRRVERGFFVPPGGAADAGAPYLLDRYQVLHSNGKLYEYPPERIQSLRSDGDVSTIELFEYDPDVPPTLESLGPDTLRLGRRVVPVEGERSLRTGANAWPVRGDTSFVNRPLLVQTFWRNSAVPITGLARSLFQVMTERVPSSERGAAPTGRSAPPVPPYDPVITGVKPAAGAPKDTAAASADTTGAARADTTTAARADTAATSATPVTSAVPLTATPTTPTAAPGTMLSWTDLILVDLGSDAKPEVTQEPEPLPEGTPPATGIR
jgi:hypothetical protein